MYSWKENISDLFDMAKIPIVGLSAIGIVTGGIFAMVEYDDSQTYKQNQQFVQECSAQHGAASISDDNYGNTVRVCTVSGVPVISTKG